MNMSPYLHGGRRAINIRSSLNQYKEGGLVKAAENVRGAGRHGDNMLVHVNEEEFEKMRKEFGDPLINPKTGIPEWGFFSSLKKIVGKLAPILGVASLIPGLQFLSPLALAARGTTAITGLTGAAANILGGTALGGITGGNKGAAIGALTGLSMPGANGDPSAMRGFTNSVLGPNTSDATKDLLERGFAGGAIGAVGGNDPLRGALSSIALGGIGDKIKNSDFVQNGLSTHPVLQQGALGAAQGLQVAGMYGSDPVKGAALGAGLGASAAALQKMGVGPPTHDLGTKQIDQTTAQPTSVLSTPLTSNPSFNVAVSDFANYKTKDEALKKLEADAGANPDQRPIYDAMTNFTACDMSSDFGSCMAQNWDGFMNSIRSNAPKMAEGGSVLQALADAGMPGAEMPGAEMPGADLNYQGMVQGEGDGQDDMVPINAARNEYVFPADAVSALGSGSSEAGAEVLDKMVQNIRAHARGAPPTKLPPKAKSPLEYMPE